MDFKNIKDSFNKAKVYVTDTVKKGASFTVILLLATTIAYQNFFPYNILWIKSIPGLKRQIEELNTKIDLADVELKKCTDGNKELTEGIDKQNAYIDKLYDNTIELQDKFNAVSKNLVTLRKQNNTRITSILSQDTPKTCDDAIQHLIKARETLQWPN